MKRPILALATLLALSGCGGAPREPFVSIGDPFVALPAVPGRPGAAYFTIRGNRPARLTAIDSPQIGRIELHESMEAGGMSSMAPLRNPGFGPDAPLVFAPGGRHAMLYDIAPAIGAGQTVALTFTFDTLPPVTIEAEVRAPGDMHGAH